MDKIDLLDAKILENLYNTTNISEIARRIGVSDETVRRRIQKLYKYGRVVIEPNYFALGLSYAAYISNWPSEHTIRLLEECYARGILRLITPKGYKIFLTLIPPLDSEVTIRVILEKLLGPGEYIPLKNPIKWRPLAKFFNMNTQTFEYSWNEFIKGILNGEIPYVDKLNENEITSKRLLDPIDLAIIEEFQIDALTPLTKIARELGIYQQKLWYHYSKHVKPIIRHNDVNIAFLPLNEAPATLHRIKFSNYEGLTRFASLSKYNPFIRAIMPSRYQLEVLLVAQFPIIQFMHFTKILTTLYEVNIIKDYKWVGFIDPNFIRAYTVPKELFVEGKWIIKKNVLEFAQAQLQGTSKRTIKTFLKWKRYRHRL